MTKRTPVFARVLLNIQRSDFCPYPSYVLQNPQFYDVYSWKGLEGKTRRSVQRILDEADRAAGHILEREEETLSELAGQPVTSMKDLLTSYEVSDGPPAWSPKHTTFDDLKALRESLEEGECSPARFIYKHLGYIDRADDARPSLGMAYQVRKHHEYLLKTADENVRVELVADGWARLEQDRIDAMRKALEYG